MFKLLSILFLLIAVSTVSAQCAANQYVDWVANGLGVRVKQCVDSPVTINNAQTQLNPGAGFPSGMIMLLVSGSCPSGFTELNFAGYDLRLTLAANADAGTTNGSATVTPTTASVSQPVFTGSPLATHAHELPFQIPSTTTTRQLAAATFGTGTSRAATAVSTAGTANTTSAAVALTQAVSAGTPAGTVSAPTVTLNSINLTPLALKIIGCRKN